jgi:hypothetical protein
MSNEHSFTLQRAAAEYRGLGGKLRDLARASVFPGPRRSLSRLAGDLSIVGLPTSDAKAADEDRP